MVGADEAKAALTDEELADERDATAAGGAAVEWLLADLERPSHELEHEAPRLPAIRSCGRGGGGTHHEPHEGCTGCGREAGIGGRGGGGGGGGALTNAVSIDAKSVVPAFSAVTTVCSRAPTGRHSARGTTSGARWASFPPRGGRRLGGVSSPSPANNAMTLKS